MLRIGLANKDVYTRTPSVSKRLLVAGPGIPRRRYSLKASYTAIFTVSLVKLSLLATKSSATSTQRPCALVKAFDRLVHRYNFAIA